MRSKVSDDVAKSSFIIDLVTSGDVFFNDGAINGF
jgi:hypothetical protein